MLEGELEEFLEGGCALLIGTVSSSGEPLCSRAWGCWVVDAARGRIRLVIDADDGRTVANLTARGAVAVTASDVPTLRSVQLKGRSAGLDAASDTGPANIVGAKVVRGKVEQYCREFYDDVARTDGYLFELCERMTPARFTTCLIDVEQVYDQTPGPAAGRLLAERR